MKRGKDEEKIMGPLFPRLHVNDTEKGGPRAPPRNKMALYEQLSIPSQRFSHAALPCNPSNTAANLVHPSSQGGGNDRGIFFARPMHPRLPSERQCSQYSESSTPLSQVGQGKKLDEDDYTVPIFVHSTPAELDKFSNEINREKLSPSNPPYLHPRSKFQKSKEMGELEHSVRQPGNNKNGENSNECVDRLGNDDSGESQLSSDTEKRSSSSNSQTPLQSEDRNNVHELSNDTGSLEDGFCGPPQVGNLERGDSVSETSVLDAISGPDITPDDIVGVIGQKQFWKARRAIVYQQRIFAVQVFELHRLIKVQKLIASSPDLTVEESACFGKPIEKKDPLEYAVKATPNVSKGKNDSQIPTHKRERSSESAIEKASLFPSQNGPPPSSCSPLAPPVAGNEHNASTTWFNHPYSNQWLIPVMSPTEGLIYKPYPGTGLVDRACGPPAPNPMTRNFSTPTYGIPAPPNPYMFPSFSAFGPHSFFSHYGMPVMATSAFSGSSEQTNPLHASARFLAREATPTVQTQKDGQEIELQASTASCPSERRRKKRNMLPLFPTVPSVDAPNTCTEVCVPKVIKVVPRDGISASESAERIFRSIQEERKQYDSV